MAPPPPPPPPRSTKPAPPKATTSAPSTPSTPPSPSRPGTPSSTAGARAPKAQTLALPALLHDLSTLLSHPTPLLSADKFAPAPPPEDAYAPRKPAQDPQQRAQELLAGVRAGTIGPDEQLAREDAPLLADAWVAAMDRVLSRAETHDAQRAGEGVVDRADEVERWAGEVERGLAQAA
ncbi:uncharacterized protein RHOBADRAFT_56229 [Rhodotorula graminis WP1]|uniref:Uncharacterized protein n=1 Tax=Rhodotorula graminis (strain WP1) TaxID=578459 RepID=A0A0P9EY43_RHOGW|nr:uncharacterized protein RHOBADRAFT_56229 [Rhodotorula graminis WP1]KPV72106.1 hypothetical protein RHOBADRAFT_56229 [Rhodotorula graminis WP1]